MAAAAAARAEWEETAVPVGVLEMAQAAEGEPTAAAARAFLGRQPQTLGRQVGHQSR